MVELLFASDMGAPPHWGIKSWAMTGHAWPHHTGPWPLGVMLPKAALGEKRKAQEPCYRLLQDLHDGSPPFLLHRFAMFHKVRIPRQNLLDWTGSVNSEGTYSTPYKVPVGCGYLWTELLKCLSSCVGDHPRSSWPYVYHTSNSGGFGALSREGA